MRALKKLTGFLNTRRKPVRCFSLVRNIDRTGVSGTGAVASGTVYSDGTADLTWNVQATLADGSKRKIDSVTIFQNWKDVALLHGHGGCSKMVWADTGESISDTEILLQKSC